MCNVTNADSGRQPVTRPDQKKGKRLGINVRKFIHRSQRNSTKKMLGKSSGFGGLMPAAIFQ